MWHVWWEDIVKKWGQSLFLHDKNFPFQRQTRGTGSWQQTWRLTRTLESEDREDTGVWTQRGQYWQQTRVLEPDNDTTVPETSKDPGVVTINMDPRLAPELQDLWLAPGVLVWLWAALAHILTPCNRVGSSYTTPIESKQLLLSSLLATLSLCNLFFGWHVLYDVTHIVPVFFETGLLSQNGSYHMCACYQRIKEYDKNSSCYQLLQYSSSYNKVIHKGGSLWKSVIFRTAD